MRFSEASFSICSQSNSVDQGWILKYNKDQPYLPGVV